MTILKQSLLSERWVEQSPSSPAVSSISINSFLVECTVLLKSLRTPLVTNEIFSCPYIYSILVWFSDWCYEASNKELIVKFSMLYKQWSGRYKLFLCYVLKILTNALLKCLIFYRWSSWECFHCITAEKNNLYSLHSFKRNTVNLCILVLYNNYLYTLQCFQ